MTNITATEILDLMREAKRRLNEAHGNAPRYWAMSPTVRRWLRRRFLTIRKQIPAPRRLSRKVHRARRKAGQPLTRNELPRTVQVS